MTRLLAIISFGISVIFYGWDITHDRWTWTLFMLIGLLLWCLSDSHPRVP
jgi:hypothetical protein